MTPSITQDAVNAALSSFLSAILPAGVTIVVGQVNRVASPEGDYCVMWPLRRPRLSTNVDTPVDSKFTGSISAGVLTVSAVDPVLNGPIGIGSVIFGVNVADGTTVVAPAGTGTGGVGTYNVSPPQTVASGTLSAGVIEVEQSTEVVMQVDVHGPASADNVQTISTLFRDGYAVDQMAAAGVTPLYADDPRQAPFTTAAAQFEDRWMVDLHMQIDPTVAVPQEFFDATALTVTDVDVAFPPQ